MTRSPASMNARSLIIHTLTITNLVLSRGWGWGNRRKKNNVTTAIKCCEIISCLYSLLCTVHGCMHYTFFSILITAQACIHKTTHTAL